MKSFCTGLIPLPSSKCRLALGVAAATLVLIAHVQPSVFAAEQTNESSKGTPRAKDAAEAVGEGNVQQWIEYYQRTRPPVEPKVSKPGESPAPSTPPDPKKNP